MWVEIYFDIMLGVAEAFVGLKSNLQGADLVFRVYLEKWLSLSDSN